MLRFRSDGAAIVTRKDYADGCSCGMVINSNGLVYMGDLDNEVLHGQGWVLAGSHWMFGEFKHGSPCGLCYQLGRDGLFWNRYENGRVTQTGRLDWDDPSIYELSSKHVPSNVILNMIEYSRLKLNPLNSWKQVVNSRLWIPSFDVGDIKEWSNTERIGVPVLRAVKDACDVVLVELPEWPPVGKHEIAQGLQMNRVDIWVRRLERLMYAECLSECIPRPLGVCELSGKFFVVSKLPEYLVSINEDLSISMDPPVGGDDSSISWLKWAKGLIRCVKSMHSIGVAMNGFVNWNCFFYNGEGNVYLNTSYFLSRVHDPVDIMGGLRGDELRFLSPCRVARMSDTMSVIVDKFLGLTLPQPLSPFEEDAISVGLMLASLLSDDHIPFPFLSHAQYIGEAICKESGEPYRISNLRPGDSVCHGNLDEPKRTHSHPIQKLADKLITRESSLDDVLMSLDKYQEWMNTHANESSMELELKALGNMFSGFIKQTFQDRK